jgi:hypothetical protein
MECHPHTYGLGLSASCAAAARHYFQTLDFLAHGFVEDGVGQEDKPVGAGVGVVIITGLPWTEYARLFGVHSLHLHPFCGPGSGVLPHLRGHLFIRQSYCITCVLIMYKV